jgi:hypothetical protein
MVSIREAGIRGIERLRLKVWSNPLCHVKLDLFDGSVGPWIHLFDPFNKVCNGRDPVDILFTQFDMNAVEWDIYEGPDSQSEEYKADAAIYEAKPC